MYNNNNKNWKAQALVNGKMDDTTSGLAIEEESGSYVWWLLIFLLGGGRVFKKIRSHKMSQEGVAGPGANFWGRECLKNIVNFGRGWTSW